MTNKNLSELSIEILKNKRSEVQNKLLDLRKQVQVLSEQILKFVDNEKEINEVIDSKTLTENDIEKLLEVFPETKHKRKLLNKILKQYGFLEIGGYWPETLQSALKIALLYNDDELTKKIYKGILELLPFIKPHNDGCKKFDIMEETLSYHGSYNLITSDDKEWHITRGGRVIYSSKDLMETLKHIQKYIFYDYK
jgi:hypothetical protein